MVIILPETRLEKAYNLFSRRIKREIEDSFSRIARDRFHLTVTIGIAAYPVDGTASHSLILAADTALLDAKKCKDRRLIGCSRPVPGYVALATP
ncbi:MAG: diguanylate cyclase [Nitrospirota bacterium]|nr:diguanylate cyclase [Nitrospirota bacterium]